MAWPAKTRLTMIKYETDKHVKRGKGEKGENRAPITYYNPADMTRTPFMMTFRSHPIP